jgi:hypothetical protein
LGTEIEKVRVVRPADFFIYFIQCCGIIFCSMSPKLSKPGKYVSLSFTAPSELEEPMNEAAAARGMNRSQYICWLVQQDMYFQERNPAGQLPPEARLAKVPPRIRRKKA